MTKYHFAELSTSYNSPYVFCDSQGRRFQEVKRSLSGTGRRAGLKDFRFHDLRHTFASHLVMKGASIKAIQELLGHADIKMAMRYSHLSQAHLKESISLLNFLPCGKEMINIDPKGKGADNLSVANPL